MQGTGGEAAGSYWGPSAEGLHVPKEQLCLLAVAACPSRACRVGPKPGTGGWPVPLTRNSSLV